MIGSKGREFIRMEKTSLLNSPFNCLSLKFEGRIREEE